MPMMALVNPVYDCLFRLAQPDSLSKEEEVGGLGTEAWGGSLWRSSLSMETFEGITCWAGAWWGHVRPVTVTGEVARSGIHPEQRTAKASWLRGCLPSRKANL